MSDFILVTGDMVMFNPPFGAATVVPVPGTLSGTGRSNVGHKPVCVDGDEKMVMVPGVTYISPPYVIPGVGMLSIDSLGGDQKATKTKSGGKAVLLKGSTFQAKFQVVAPAMQPTPTGPVPDATPSYSGGTGMFVTTNMQVKGT
ncbi:MAG TPA: hypothetical protein VFJ82_14230 [Longimicrobium sp.]|nr:hypothetical protein [Longimicrobium sp.]